MAQKQEQAQRRHCTCGLRDGVGPKHQRYRDQQDRMMGHTQPLAHHMAMQNNGRCKDEHEANKRMPDDFDPTPKQHDAGIEEKEEGKKKGNSGTEKKDNPEM